MSIWKRTKATIPMRAASKKRPVVTRTGTYMPKPYRHWKETFAHLARIGLEDSFSGPVHLRLVFHTDETEIEIVESPRRAPKHLRQSDLDNLIGGVMDALQASGVIENDRQVVSVSAYMGDEDA